MRTLILAVAALAYAVPASAACDAFTTAPTSKTGADLVTAWKGLIGCDATQIETQFPLFLKAADANDTAVELALAAIDAKAYTPVWNMLDALPRSNRDDVSAKIGAACDTHADVLPFLQGAYYGLTDVKFTQWDDAYVACKAEGMGTWVEGLVKAPPQKTYDDKYGTVLKIYAKRKHADALPAFEAGAVASAANGGPFVQLLDAFDAAIQPEDAFASGVAPEDEKKVKEALGRVAQQVDPAHASTVADRLNNSGDPAAAAALLPRVYPDKVQAGGAFLYGIAAVEVCDKDALVHFTTLSEPGKRWSVVTDAEAAARAGFVPKLKCTSTWPVAVTPTPIKAEELQAFVDGVVAQYTAKSLAVKTKEEKALTLP